MDFKTLMSLCFGPSGESESMMKGCIELYFLVFDSFLPPLRFSSVATSVQIVIVGKDVDRMESAPTVSSEPWTKYFYVWLLGIAQEKISLPFSHFSFSPLGTIKPYMFSYVETEKGGSALSCNIDEQDLITIITAGLSNVLWTCDTHVCLNSPFNFQNKRSNLVFVCLNFIFVVFDVNSCCLFL